MTLIKLFVHDSFIPELREIKHIKSDCYLGYFHPPSENSGGYYIIKCDDGHYRRFQTGYFLTLQQIRSNKIEKILNNSEKSD